MDGRNKKFILELQKKPKLRRESGLYVIDGPKMAGETDPDDVDEIYITKAFLSSQGFLECEELIRQKKYTIITDSEMKQISDTVSPQGILIIARQRKYKGLMSFAAESRKYAEHIYSGRKNKSSLFIILERLQDPGNLGTIIRAAEACGVTGIIADNETCDIYSPKVVRSTMGAVLRLPFIAVSDLGKAVKSLKCGELTGEKISVYAAHLNGASDYVSADFTAPSAFMIGNESKGLSDELTELAEKKLLIPMCGSVESLNAAIAAAVVGFEASRQRRSAHT